MVEHVQAVPSQFQAQVADDSGKPLIQTPQTQTVTIQVPATQKQLEDWSKGDSENADYLVCGFLDPLD